MANPNLFNPVNCSSGWLAKAANLVFFVLFFVIYPQVLAAQVQVQDALGRTITLSNPAQRIISLAPHITEQLYSIGAGERIVGAVEYSDYPTAAKNIQRIGNYNLLDYERITALKPDLIITWFSGNGMPVAQKLKEFGFAVYITEPKRLEDIAWELRNFGQLTGLTHKAEEVSSQYMQTLKNLQQKHQSKKKIRVFYQIWNRPMMTVNQHHMISKIIEVCGGQNIFANNITLASNVDIEAVVYKNPQAIIASGSNMNTPVWLKEWNKWTVVSAVKNRHIFSIPADIIQRHSNRILEGASKMCGFLDEVRQSNL